MSWHSLLLGYYIDFLALQKYQIKVKCSEFTLTSLNLAFQNARVKWSEVNFSLTSLKLVLLEGQIEPK
jgi:hypothetical protein